MLKLMKQKNYNEASEHRCADQQKVVSGSIDSATLIKKLGKAGGHAEIWSQKPNI